MFPDKKKVRGLERHPDIYPFCQFHEKCPHFSLFIRTSLRRDVLWYTTVRFTCLCSNLRTPWPIHFKFHRDIGIDGLIILWKLWDFIYQIVGDFSYVAL